MSFPKMRHQPQAVRVDFLQAVQWAAHLVDHHKAAQWEAEAPVCPQEAIQWAEWLLAARAEECPQWGAEGQ